MSYNFSKDKQEEIVIAKTPEGINNIVTDPYLCTPVLSCVLGLTALLHITWCELRQYAYL